MKLTRKIRREKAADNWPGQEQRGRPSFPRWKTSRWAVSSGGHCAAMQVLDYGERATTNGCVLVSGPGNDLAGVTGQIAAGAVLVIATTGRGTPTDLQVRRSDWLPTRLWQPGKPNWLIWRRKTSGKAKDLAAEAPGQRAYEKIMEITSTESERKHVMKRTSIKAMGCLKDGVTL